MESNRSNSVSQMLSGSTGQKSKRASSRPSSCPPAPCCLCSLPFFPEIEASGISLSLSLPPSLPKHYQIPLCTDSLIRLEIFWGLDNVLGMALGAEDIPPPPKLALTFGQPGSGPGSAQKSRSGGQGSKVQGEEWRPREADSKALSGQGRGIRLSRYCVQPGQIKSQDCLLAPRRARHQCDSEERPGRSGLRKVKNDTSEHSQLIQELRLRWRGRRQQLEGRLVMLRSVRFVPEMRETRTRVNDDGKER